MSASQASRLCITDKIRFGFNDAEALPIERCVCGKTFGHWDFFIENDPKYPTECPACGRKMWFDCGITVWQEVAPNVVPAAAAAANATAAAAIAKVKGD